MDEKRYLKIKDKKEGPFSIQQIMRMTELGEANHRTEFWAKSSKSWEPLTRFMCDIEPSNVSQLEEAGIEHVEVLTSGTGTDCPACMALSGKVFPIDDRPELPPVDCTCLPWCRSMFIASLF